MTATSPITSCRSRRRPSTTPGRWASSPPAGVDLVSAFTIDYVDEAIGIANAAAAASVPVVISFTVETDGIFRTARPLPRPSRRWTDTVTRRPAYFMINCAHPTHVLDVLAVEGPWRDRLRGFRANASPLSHAELDDSETLDIDDLAEFGALFADVRRARSEHQRPRWVLWHGRAPHRGDRRGCRALGSGLASHLIGGVPPLRGEGPWCGTPALRRPRARGGTRRARTGT